MKLQDIVKLIKHNITPEEAEALIKIAWKESRLEQ